MNIVVNANNLEFPGVIDEVELTDLAGNSLGSFDMTIDPHTPSRYNVSGVVMPDDYFYLKVLPI